MESGIVWSNGGVFSTQRSIEYLPAEAVGVVAAEPGFRPSRLAKWASKASNKLLGAYKIHIFLLNIFPIKVHCVPTSFFVENLKICQIQLSVKLKWVKKANRVSRFFRLLEFFTKLVGTPGIKTKETKNNTLAKSGISAFSMPTFYKKKRKTKMRIRFLPWQDPECHSCQFRISDSIKMKKWEW